MDGPITLFESLDDVQKVDANFDIDLMAATELCHNAESVKLTRIRQSTWV
jgi:hypothetical protein